VVTLSWLPSTSGTPTGYLLEAGGGPALSNIATVALGVSTTFTTAGVPAGTYYVRIRAANAAGISEPSGDVILVVP
jgi:predicted phage tail protein